MRISGWEETQDKRREAGEGEAGGVRLRERDEKREPGKEVPSVF